MSLSSRLGIAVVRRRIRGHVHRGDESTMVAFEMAYSRVGLASKAMANQKLVCLVAGGRGGMGSSWLGNARAQLRRRLIGG